MKRKGWWLGGIVVACLVAGACSGELWSLATRWHQRLNPDANGRWEWESQEAFEQRVLGPPQHSSPQRPVPQQPARSPYHSEAELRALQEAAPPGVPDGTLPEPGADPGHG